MLSHNVFTTLLAYKQLPAAVDGPIRHLMSWLLWTVETALIARIVWVGGRAGWEHYHPAPGPPEAPGDVVRSLVAWIIASFAWPIAMQLLFI